MTLLKLMKTERGHLINKRRLLSIAWLLLLLISSSCGQSQGTPTAMVPTEVSEPTQVAPTALPTALPATPVPTTLAPEGLSIGDPYAPELGNEGYDVQHYTLHLALDPKRAEVEGYASIEAMSMLDDLEQISLDFVGFDISAVTVDEVEAQHSRADKKLVIDLPETLASDTPFTIKVEYNGAPLDEPSQFVPFIEHLGLQFQGDGLYVVSEPDGARYWFPCNDHPRDKATFRFEIVVPEGLAGVANGELIETQTEVPQAFADGRPGDVYVWEHNFPMASYLATVAVGDYVRVESTSPDGVQLRSYIFPEAKADFERLQPTLGEAIDWMADQFGPYPFEEFGYVMVNGLGASLETQTMVIAGSLDEGTMVHEMAHQWFGDWVSLDSWQTMWRNEGFATYIATLWAVRNNPDQFEAQWDDLVTQVPQGDYPLSNPPPQFLFGSDSYNKGALFVHAIRKAVGDDAFYEGLGLYFERYGGQTASDADFQAAMEEASGQSLDELFEAWLN